MVKRAIMVATICIAIVCGCGSPSAKPGTEADPCHDGAVTYCVLNPAVTQATINQTICVHGWTKTVRPPVEYTDHLKVQQMAAEKLAGTTADYEEDHRMPLNLGGAPDDTNNLSPESGASPNPKDNDELHLYQQVCAGQMTLAQARQDMVTKWLAPYPSYRS